MRALLGIIPLLAAGSLLAGCGCNDIGCGSGVVIVGGASVQQVTLKTSAGSIDCPSTSGACSRVALEGGGSEFHFNVEPTPSVEVRAKDAADATVFEGALALTIEKVEIGPNACEGDCASGRGTLPL